MALPENKTLLALVGVGGIAAFIIGLVAASLARIETDEVGVAYDVHQKTLGEDVKTAGLHTGSPGIKFIKFPSVFKTIQFKSIKCLNKQGLEIKISEEFQYRARPKDLRKIIMEYKDHDTYVKLLRTLALAAIHDSCSEFNTSQFQTQRAVFQERVRTLTAQRFHNISADLTDLQVSNIMRPSSFELAVRAKETAKENIKVAETQRPRKLIQANTRKQEAITSAQMNMQKAQSEVSVILVKGDAEAAQITTEFESEAKAYETVMKGQNLTVDGLLSYMGVRVVAEAKDVNVAIKGPAKTKYTYT